ncbi:hypothetical protein CU100_10035 [Phyllobacterium endophyticum]|uniref:Uncharacterized protein n=2 Tax=Phyllobacterium endophyticum TaxID=1149773 RepID=A0A2P7AUU3_9HYPH|nr:hypothetical protein CU100_10035 [Phyllobacterium endophyticum]
MIMVDARERAARALCRKAGNVEMAKFEGKPLWMSYLDEVDTVFRAILDAPGSSYHLVFDSLPSPKGARFIELEDDNGKSIEIGEWRARSDGNCELVLPLVRQ